MQKVDGTKYVIISLYFRYVSGFMLAPDGAEEPFYFFLLYQGSARKRKIREITVFFAHATKAIKMRPEGHLFARKTAETGPKRPETQKPGGATSQKPPPGGVPFCFAREFYTKYKNRIENNYCKRYYKSKS